MLKRFNYAAILLGSLALGITMSATGCGDSGDTTPSSSVSNNKTAGPVTVQLDSKAQEIIATNNITNVEYLFTDKDGKQVKLTSQQITPTNSSKKLSKAEAKDGRVDTKTTTITIEGVPKVSTEVVAVYYSDNGEIAALQCSKLDWTSTVAISSGALYDARNANYTFDASAELIKKGDYTDLHVGAIPKDYVPSVTGQPDIDLTGLIEVKIDNKYFETKGNSDIIGRYYGKEYTTYDGSVASVNFKTIDGEQKLSTNPIFVTDRVLDEVKIEPSYPEIDGIRTELGTNIHEEGEYLIMCPPNTDKIDYAFGKEVVSVFTYKDSAAKDIGNVAVRKMPIAPTYIRYNTDSNKDKGNVPNTTELYEVEYRITDRDGNPMNGDIVNDTTSAYGFATVSVDCSKSEKEIPFYVVATIKPSAKNKVDKELVSTPLKVRSIYVEPIIEHGIKGEDGSYKVPDIAYFKPGTQVNLHLVTSFESEDFYITDEYGNKNQTGFFSYGFDIPESVAYYPDTYFIDDELGKQVQGLEVAHEKGSPIYTISCTDTLPSDHRFKLNADESGFALFKEYYLKTASFTICPAQ